MSNDQQKRLQQQHRNLKAEWELRNEKLKSLRYDLAIEAGTAVKFQLEKQIIYEEAKVNDLEQQLNAIEAKLQFHSQRETFINKISPQNIHQSFDVISSTELIKVFISYSKKSSQDAKLCEELEKSLSSLQEQGIIKIWQERRIVPGKNIVQEITKHLYSSQIILLLITPNFVAEYYRKVEIVEIQRQKAEKMCVIPILVSQVNGWQGLKFGDIELSTLQYLPKNGRFVTGKGWKNKNEAFFTIAQEFAEEVDKLVDDLP